MGYKLLQTKVLDIIHSYPPCTVNIHNTGTTFSILTLILIMTAFAIGIAIGSSLDDLKRLLFIPMYINPC